MILERAYEIAEVAYRGLVDKAGVDYYGGHITAVANAFNDDEVIEKSVALLHDVLEDTDIDASELRLLLNGHDPRVADLIVEAVVAITKNGGESYDTYLIRVKSNRYARVVKRADIAHNMDLNRLVEVTEKDLARVEKYRSALEFLV